MKKLTGLFQITLVFALIFWFLFYKLGDWPFRNWDESRLITSAYEMLRNHEYLTPTVDNNIDMWSTKPPLMIWAEALSIKEFGLCEWSARLPAALCGMLTILVTAGFVSRLLKSRWAAVASVIVLCTSGGLIGYHAARFGEYDAMLTLFTTSYLLSFFMYTESDGDVRNRYLMLFFIFLTLACLTKGIAGMLFTPALAMYLIMRGQLLPTLLNRRLYTGLFLFIVFVPGYYLLREHINPGYIHAIWENELGGRFNTASGGPVSHPDYYVESLWHLQFSTWRWALVVSLASIWFLSNRRTFRAAVFCWITSAFLLLVLSKGETRMPWYDLPVFPLFAIIVSMVIFQLAEIAGKLPFLKQQTAIVLLIIIFSIQPVIESYSFLRWEYDDLYGDSFYSASYYFREAIAGRKNLNNTIFLSGPYNLQWRLYVKQLNDSGVHIEDCTDAGSRRFKVGDRVIVNQEDKQQVIEKNYNYKLVEKYYGVKNYLITSVK